MPTFLLYFCLAAAVAAWCLYLEKTSATFIEGLTLLAWGITGLFAGGMMGARHGFAGICVGAICGVMTAYASVFALGDLACGLYRLYL